MMAVIAGRATWNILFWFLRFWDDLKSNRLEGDESGIPQLDIFDTALLAEIDIKS
jgi:hypothetical protein